MLSHRVAVFDEDLRRQIASSARRILQGSRKTRASGLKSWTTIALHLPNRRPDKNIKGHGCRDRIAWKPKEKSLATFRENDRLARPDDHPIKVNLCTYCFERGFDQVVIAHRNATGCYYDVAVVCGSDQGVACRFGCVFDSAEDVDPRPGPFCVGRERITV